MSFYQGRGFLPHRFRLVLSSFLQKDGLPFSEVLSEAQIDQAFEEQDACFATDAQSVYTPAVTLWAFLSQVLHKHEQRSCVAAVARVAVLWAVLLSLATGMVTGMAMGPYAGKETGEPALLRELLGHFQEGDILLGDRYYCSYFLVALLMELGVDFVVRLHQCRPADFRRGRRLGRGDRLVKWQRPQRPPWMDRATYQRIPNSIEVRQLEVRVDQPGFRCQSLIGVTTLTDAKAYPAEDMATLYRQRWLAELDIRAIKITLGMDILRCKTPEMVRREVWTCLLAYNLIRRTMLQAARASGVSPRRLSFSAAMQAIAASWITAVLNDSLAARLIGATLTNLAGHQVGNRPGRIEPRAVKRRPKPHRLLIKPRGQARTELLADAST